MNQIIIKRVSYGKSFTPIKDREYKLITGSPIGTIDDWKDFSKKQNINKLIIIEKDGSERAEEI